MIAVDLFAGGGGASEGIRLATGKAPRVAINHDPAAIQMHAANHPGTMHLCEDVFAVTPFRPSRKDIDLLWASPDCTHHSRAKGGKPRSSGRRSLAWVVVQWARAVRPRVICLENVEEFAEWGPLTADNQPDPTRKGEIFRDFCGALTLLGYRVAWKVLKACDYGAPTSRKRLFLVARCDGAEPVWPEPTHGPGRPAPWRTAAECIDWSIPAPSIFDRARPLAEATLRRVAHGVVRYVLEDLQPYIVQYTHGGRVHGLDAPLPTITARPAGGDMMLVSPTLIQVGYGEREGQAPRVLDLHAPLGTVVAGGAKHALCVAFMAKHYGGVVGHDLRQPLGTVTTVDHHSPVTVDAHPMPLPPELMALGRRTAAFLVAYYGSEADGQSIRRPLRTVPTVDRFGLVTVEVDGGPYAIVDIGLRMLQPRELATAQGFREDYILTGTKREQVGRIGNSVSPAPACAVVRANLGGIGGASIRVAA